ncbi:MAG TPA: hypothetical protein HA292_03510 [Candidatus Nitrosotenuis sp.]|jgi:hypothetical protein|nr:hypothetical protein [Candidatus Nitrosotenuis sp.]HII04042.1 hypothetical protein [Candidatus Nitrosotenuis sp.]
MDRILVGAGLALVGLGVGFLATSTFIFEIREPFILGGLLWTVVGGVTAVLGKMKSLKKTQPLGALG